MAYQHFLLTFWSILYRKIKELFVLRYPFNTIIFVLTEFFEIYPTIRYYFLVVILSFSKSRHRVKISTTLLSVMIWMSTWYLGEDVEKIHKIKRMININRKFHNEIWILKVLKYLDSYICMLRSMGKLETKLYTFVRSVLWSQKRTCKIETRVVT